MEAGIVLFVFFCTFFRRSEKRGKKKAKKVAAARVGLDAASFRFRRPLRADSASLPLTGVAPLRRSSSSALRLAHFRRVRPEKERERERNGAATAWRWGENDRFTAPPPPSPKKKWTNGFIFCFSVAAFHGVSRPRWKQKTRVKGDSSLCVLHPQPPLNHLTHSVKQKTNPKKDFKKNEPKVRPLPSAENWVALLLNWTKNPGKGTPSREVLLLFVEMGPVV